MDVARSNNERCSEGNESHSAEVLFEYRSSFRELVITGPLCGCTREETVTDHRRAQCLQVYKLTQHYKGVDKSDIRQYYETEADEQPVGTALGRARLLSKTA